MDNAPLRVVFMGTPEFAIPALETLQSMDSVEVVAVYTAPDAASRRGTRIYQTPVRAVAEEFDIPVFTPDILRGESEEKSLASLAPDLIVVAAYGQILPAAILDIPRFGSINIHASLLPRWRGAAPIQRALLAGDQRTGVSLMRMEEGLDTGDYCAQASTPLPDTLSFDEIQMALARKGARLLAEHLEEIVAGTATWIPQDEDEVTYAHKIEKAAMILEPTLSARELFARIRASNQSAPARMRVGGKDVRILAAELVEADHHSSADDSLRALYADLAPGRLRFAEETVIVSGSDPKNAALILTSVIPAGKHEMTARQWAHGLRAHGDLAWE
jgi:methionyl-tRNA formyltransferase